MTKEERWLFDGMVLRSQLLVILSRRVRARAHTQRCAALARFVSCGFVCHARSFWISRRISDLLLPRSSGVAVLHECDRPCVRTWLQVLTDPDGPGILPEGQGDLAHGRLKSLKSLEQMMEIDQAMR